MRTAAYSRRIEETGALEAMLEDAAERMDPGHIVHQALDIYHALPEDVSHAAVKQGKTIFKLAPFLIGRFVATLASVFGANPVAWSQFIARSRAGAARQLALTAGQAIGLRPQTARITHPPGMSPTQVRQYGRRQRQRGYNAVRGRRPGRQREMELEHELGLAANALAAETESAPMDRFYFDSWTWTANGWRYLARDGPMPMTSLAEAKGMPSVLRLKYQALARSVGGTDATVQCFKFYPQTQRWGLC
jgi:hypothetical protein